MLNVDGSTLHGTNQKQLQSSHALTTLAELQHNDNKFLAFEACFSVSNDEIDEDGEIKMHV